MEKRTIGEFLQDNKQRIVKGLVIAASLAAGVVIIKALKNSGTEQITGTVRTFVLEETPESFGVVKDVAENI